MLTKIYSPLLLGHTARECPWVGIFHQNEKHLTSPKEKQRQKERDVLSLGHMCSQQLSLPPRWETRCRKALGQGGNFREMGVLEWLGVEKAPHWPRPFTSRDRFTGWVLPSHLRTAFWNMLPRPFWNLWHSWEHTDISCFVQRVRRTHNCFPASKLSEMWQKRAGPSLPCGRTCSPVKQLQW